MFTHYAKKGIIIFTLIMMLMSSVSMVSAQRGIDASLQPKNVPGVPSTGRNCPIDQIKTNDDGTASCNDTSVQCESGVFDATTGICLGEEDEPINAFLQVIAGALLMLSGGLGVIIVAVGGLLYVTSHGNQQQLEFAKKTLVYGVMGMLVIIFSYFIIQTVIQIIVRGI